jgi:hypothetical protein
MPVEALTPILNVSDLEQSFEWFARLGWKKGLEGHDRRDLDELVSRVARRRPP